jgi:hypothetical protein
MTSLDYRNKLHDATTVTIPNIPRPSDFALTPPFFFVAVSLAAAPVPVPPTLIVSLPVCTAASCVTTPALVNTKPCNSTNVLLIPIPKVSVLACLFSTPAFASVKQYKSVSRGVVAHPFGQHTLLVPRTEKVV